MKKKLLTLASMLMAAFGTLCAQNVVYYSQDFQGDSKPAELLYYDADGNELHDDLVGTGLECGTWHLIKMSATDSNKLIGSASMFTTPGKANDWMVTPQIKIYGSGTKLSWKSMSATRTKKDGLKVYISTKGYSIEDFETDPIFSIEEEEAGTLQSHEVSLDKYVGQTIYIAFVNDSYDKYVLCVDDIQVSGPAANEAQDRAVFQVTTPLMTDTGEAKMSLNVENVKTTTLDALTVCFRANGQEYNQTFTGLNLGKNKVASLTLDQKVNVPLNTTLVYDMWVEVDGDRSLTVRDSIRGTYFVSNRRTLIEEGTGTWCGNCPGGSLALQYMEEHYPDNVVGIAVHSDNATDPMYYPDYTNFCEYSAYPTMLVDRKYLGLPAALDDDYNFSFMSPGGVEYFYLMAQRFLAEAELSGTARLVDSKINRLEIKVDSRFINDVKSEGYDIALILLEDSVTAPDGTLYKQQNYYSSTNYIFIGLKDTLTGSGGWGKLPGTVSMKFNHVARAAYNGSFNGYGNTNGLPANIKGGQTYTSTYIWDVPAGTVNHMKNASLVALMTDAIGNIVNCCKMHVTINNYSLTYKVDGVEYKKYEVTYGDSLVVETEPTKEGYTFSGWSEAPATMPANDVVIDGSFTINNYSLTYKVDGVEYKKYEVTYGDSLVVETEPTKEGYTFSGWSEVPAIMPAKDVTIEGKFNSNIYKVTYMVDGVEYATDSVIYNQPIVIKGIPTKEGYTFSGWSEAPATMPANDVVINGSFTINNYSLTYKVDGVEYKKYEVTYGDSLVAEIEPCKEGYTFSGWSEIPPTMPASDIVIKGSYLRNSYILTYMVDGVVYSTQTIPYESKIKLLNAPQMEGYTFSGWDCLIDSMPANDLIVNGYFTANSYKLTYIVDGKEYKQETKLFGSQVEPIDMSEKEGYTFSGWGDVPNTMPSKDLVLKGEYIVNKHSITYYVDGAIYKTIEVTYGSLIQVIDEPQMEGYTFSGWSEIPETMPDNDVTIEGTFNVNKYAIKYIVDGEEYATDSIIYNEQIVLRPFPNREGYTFSGWSEIPSSMPANDIVVSGEYSINSYQLTYMIDGDVYTTMQVAYGTPIYAIANPSKEGYIFSGWSEIPKTMPAEDVIVIGFFEVDGINAILSNRLVDVYTLQGVMVKRDVPMEDLEKELSTGIYIVNGKKFIVK